MSAQENEMDNLSFKTMSKLSAALAKAQGEFPVIPKDSEVEVKNKEGKFLYKYKYADLTTIISCTRPSLSNNGLSFTQTMINGGLHTVIMHESGEQLLTGFVPFAIPQGSDMKTVAGLFTYVKRISLTAALGVSADEDIDAAHNEAEAGNNTSKNNINRSKGIEAALKSTNLDASSIIPNEIKKTVATNKFTIMSPEKEKSLAWIKEQLAKQPNWEKDKAAIFKKITGASNVDELNAMPYESLTEITKLLLTTYKIED